MPTNKPADLERRCGEIDTSWLVSRKAGDLMSGSLAGTGSEESRRAGIPPQSLLGLTEQQSPHAMNGEPFRCKVTITNPQGFHMRPMSAFVQLAGKFQSSVQVIRPDGQRIDGKSMLGLLSLAAEQGTELTLEVTGPDAEAALPVLAELMARPSADDDV
jgi:phosphotransferase system HPr (HPr) family protein